MRIRYPAIKTNKEHRIAVDDHHELYLEESGNQDGIPVLFVHGGPGGGTQASDRCFFDPEKYRIILFDQRGCGLSTPHASLQDNSTQHLVADIEIIRKTLGVERWLLFGGSWGSTLSLVYAQTYPEKVLGMVLRGIFLCRDKDIAWLYQEGSNRIFPDYWQDYVRMIPTNERHEMVAAYYHRLTSDNELERMSAAKAWSIWEARTATLGSSPAVVGHIGSPHVALAMARVECHYFLNHGFMVPDQIINNMARLAVIPAIIIHGRYDMVCPLDQALALYQAWPDAKLEIIRNAGHASSEPGTIDALVKATDEFANKLGDQAF